MQQRVVVVGVGVRVVVVWVCVCGGVVGVCGWVGATARLGRGACNVQRRLPAQ